ncbi:CBS domain-containing protein [Azospirillum argentinense]|uniref:CBS domain-containing protein n=1 Tax=Azospirillum argentinense TaxID=2970906 RepID=UPI0027E24B4E|nr:CBS domain-containing protein [Azospirillum argentinense]
MISEGTQTGVFAPEEKEMIDGVLRLADRSVRSIMTPRPDVVRLDLGDPQDLLLAEIRSGSHSRYPVCRGELDELVGVVHTRDLLDDAVHRRPFDLAASAAKPLVVHDGTPILKLLDLMKTSGHHLALVVDEYGSIEGVVTLTDILGTIAGDLPEAGEKAEHAAIQREDGSWLVEGWMPVDEFEDSAGCAAPATSIRWPGWCSITWAMCRWPARRSNGGASGWRIPASAATRNSEPWPGAGSQAGPRPSSSRSPGQAPAEAPYRVGERPDDQGLRDRARRSGGAGRDDTDVGDTKQRHQCSFRSADHHGGEEKALPSGDEHRQHGDREPRDRIGDRAGERADMFDEGSECVLTGHRQCRTGNPKHMGANRANRASPMG